MKRALTIALAVAVFGAAHCVRTGAGPYSGGQPPQISMPAASVPLSETDTRHPRGARLEAACTGDLTMARFHFMTGNPVAGAFHLLAAYFRPAICA